MARKQKISLWGCGFSIVALALACGPIDPGDDGSWGTPGTTGDWGSGGSSVTTTTGSSGGAQAYCPDKAPPQTYLCAGDAYESDSAGAASLRLGTERARYSCQEDEYWYWYYEDYGYQYYDDYYSGGDGDGDWYGGDGDGDGDGDYNYGGASAGGAASMGGSTGPGPVKLLSDWCADLDADDRVAGAAFAVGQCQLTDLALPIKFTEPEDGHYEVFVYGGSSPCDRDVLLAKTAGFGTGLTVNMPVDVSGVDFVSIQLMSNDSWDDVELRLVDRPAVGDSSGE